MSSNSAVYSVAKAGKRYFWIIEYSEFIYDPSRDALAEGFATTKEDALQAIKKASDELGIEPTEGHGKLAIFYRKYWLNRDKVKDEPETDMFQNLPYIWRNGHYTRDQDGEYISFWEKCRVLRVTSKYVFISHERSIRHKRLDREALEQDGQAVGGSVKHRENYYTEAGYQVAVAQEAEKERQKQAERAIWLERKAKRDEETRISLIGKTCVFCGEAPDRYTEDKHPACSPCNKKAQGYYRVPPGLILPFRTIDKI